MDKIGFNITRSSWLHLRVGFSAFLLPVFVFSVSQVPAINPTKALLVFIVWHFFVYPASNGYNSYFDKDEGSIALIEKPPPVDKSLYILSLSIELFGILLSLFVGYHFTIAVLIYGLLSKLYSHPATRLKKFPVVSFLVVFIFQGAFVYWSTYSAISDSATSVVWDLGYVVGGLICSCLIGASYPLTQVYQHEEDARRGDQTLSLLLGIKGTFLFSALLFLTGLILIFLYWKLKDQLAYFWIFLPFAAAAGYRFFRWYLDVNKDTSEASFTRMTSMTVTSSILMLCYFTFLWICKWLEV